MSPKMSLSTGSCKVVKVFSLDNNSPRGNTFLYIFGYFTEIGYFLKKISFFNPCSQEMTIFLS